MKSPEKRDIHSDDYPEENNNKKYINNKNEKKKKLIKNLTNSTEIDQQPYQVKFEEQEIIEFILMDFKGPRELSNFKNMKQLYLIQQNINSLKVI
jgi:hypothetical protein